jgi:hypothetical protein
MAFSSAARRNSHFSAASFSRAKAADKPHSFETRALLKSHPFETRALLKISLF